MAYRLGVDVGGTFTDLLLIDESSGRTYRAKTASTPADQSIGVLAGVEKVCRLAGIEPGQVSQIMHGTTVATNAVLEGKGARVGLVVTRGYRQVLQIARSFVPGGLAGWIVWPKPEPPAALEHTAEADERVDARGEVLRPLDEAQVREALRYLRAREIETLTVSLVNAYANGAHERRIRELAADELPELSVSLSSEVLPELREYERTLTTVMNSYVRPTVSRYLGSLQTELRGRGLDAHLHVLRSDGGLMGVETAAEVPVRMLLSGPAGGVSGALWIAQQAGYGNLLTFDMGGTSTDVALVEHGSPGVGRETTVGAFTVRSSSIDVRTVGAGGGSIAHVPELTGALRVGLQSAGAEPGPAAYGKGGTAPTVTDANVVLGCLPPRLLGGEIELDVGAATTAVGIVASALGLSTKQAAAGIVDIVNENMLGALRLVSVQRGYDPRDFALVAFGGAGPLHANALGRVLGSWPVIIPPSPGVLCAYGDATTALRGEAARTFIRRFSATSNAEVARHLRDLAHAAAAELDAEGVARHEQSTHFQVDVRYHGQGFEVPVDIEVDDAFDADGLRRAGAAFDDIHTRLFTFALDQEHELVNLRAIVRGKPIQVEAAEIPVGGADPSPAETGRTSVWIDDADREVLVYDRAQLRAGNRIPGPAIVVEMDSTTLILPAHTGEVDRFGTIVIRPVSELGS